jgi:hypothetical protein
MAKKVAQASATQRRCRVIEGLLGIVGKPGWMPDASIHLVDALDGPQPIGAGCNGRGDDR